MSADPVAPFADARKAALNAVLDRSGELPRAILLDRPADELEVCRRQAHDALDAYLDAAQAYAVALKRHG